MVLDGVEQERSRGEGLDEVDEHLDRAGDGSDTGGRSREEEELDGERRGGNRRTRQVTKERREVEGEWSSGWIRKVRLLRC
jgi:hypothetical protein